MSWKELAFLWLGKISDRYKKPLLSTDLQIPYSHSFWHKTFPEARLHAAYQGFQCCSKRTFTYYKIIFELLEDKTARPSGKEGLQVSKFSLFNLLESPLWWGQPHLKVKEWVYLSCWWKVMTSCPCAGQKDSCINHPCSPCSPTTEIIWPLEYFKSDYAEYKRACGLFSDTGGSLGNSVELKSRIWSWPKALRLPSEWYSAIQIACI